MKEDDADLGIDALVAMLERFVASLQARLARWGEAGADLDRLLAAAQTAFGGMGALLAAMTVVGAATALMQIVAVRTLRRWFGAQDALAASLMRLAAFTVSLVIGLACARLLAQGNTPAKISLTAAAVAAALAVSIWSLHHALILAVRATRPGAASPALRRLAAQINLALAWALAGAAIIVSLFALGAGAGLRDLVGTFGFGLPVVIAIGVAVFGHRRRIAGLIGGMRPRSVLRGSVARRWPMVLIAALVLLFLSGQIAFTVGSPLPPLMLIAAALALLSLPYLDAMLRRWSRTADGIDSLPAVRVAMRRTARPAAMAAILALLLSVWLAPAFAVTGAGTGRIVWLAVEIALIGLVSAFAWNIVTVLLDRAVRGVSGHPVGEEHLDAPRTRFETLAPLLAATAKAIIGALGALSILVALGVSVWPIVTGLSVFGIAIGFGSQTLVKDIVSGLFFLADDAFRMGEYIETSGAKGTVEKISLRSVSLRHHRGPLATIPYGSIGRVLNFSRDYAIEKIAFRVAIDTDVDNLRKIFKKIGVEIAQDPELAPDLLEPFKSQGIAELEDGTLIVRGKFMAKAGRQHNIRKKVMLAVHKAFLENGIKAVGRDGGR